MGASPNMPLDLHDPRGGNDGVDSSEWRAMITTKLQLPGGSLGKHLAERQSYSCCGADLKGAVHVQTVVLLDTAHCLSISGKPDVTVHGS